MCSKNKELDIVVHADPQKIRYDLLSQKKNMYIYINHHLANRRRTSLQSTRQNNLMKSEKKEKKTFSNANHI